MLKTLGSAWVWRMARPTNALIVDDEPHVRVYLRQLLKELGIEHTWEASNGAEALKMVAELKPEAILLDMNMPGMSGLTVLTELAAINPFPPVIVVSSQNAAKTILECRKLGAVAYVLKHLPKNEALKMLGEGLDALDDGT